MFIKQTLSYDFELCDKITFSVTTLAIRIV